MSTRSGSTWALHSGRFKKILAEVAVFTPRSALIAAEAGAGRVELCSGYSEGGLSPSAASILYVREWLKIPVHVMVRPRIGDFLYDEVEKNIIVRDIEFCKDAGIDGIVVGALDHAGTVDNAFVSRIVRLAHPMKVTFHRAFDLISDQAAALETLVQCGVHRVLTSGGKNRVVDALDKIAELADQAANRIIILPGGGINGGNVMEIIQKTGVREIHFSGKEKVSSPLSGLSPVSLTSHGDVSDNEWYESSAIKIRELLRTLDK